MYFHINHYSWTVKAKCNRNLWKVIHLVVLNNFQLNISEKDYSKCSDTRKQGYNLKIVFEYQEYFTLFYISLYFKHTHIIETISLEIKYVYYTDKCISQVIFDFNFCPSPIWGICELLGRMFTKHLDENSTASLCFLGLIQVLAQSSGGIIWHHALWQYDACLIATSSCSSYYWLFSLQMNYLEANSSIISDSQFTSYSFPVF